MNEQKDGIKNGLRCPLCNNLVVELTKDHIIPKAVGGLDVPSNIQMICSNCNQLKNKLIDRLIIRMYKRMYEDPILIEKFRP
jgi:5-methylcytosine-specific restriction endonuclease McrA